MKKPKKEPTIKDRVTSLAKTSKFCGKLLDKLDRRITKLENKPIPQLWH